MGDTRSELTRGKEHRALHSSMDANTRKMRELSSEVLGADRRMEKSTSCPRGELRSLHINDQHCTDSRLDHHMSAEHEKLLASEAPLQDYRERIIQGNVQIWPWKPGPQDLFERSAEEKRHNHEERVCWDSPSGWEATSELARRHRDRFHGMTVDEPRRHHLQQGH